MTSTLAPGAQAKAITNPATTSRFHEDIIAGLSANQKTIPSQWLYDEKGSKLFEEITRLPEYYPTRTETEILRSHADQLTSRINAEAVLIEYGAGASEKTRILLDQLPDLSAYVPIDVSEDFLAETAQDLRESYPGLKVEPVVADFLGDIKMPPLPENQRVGFFPGSTIGNLSDPEIHAFLIRAHRLIGGSGAFILGVDLRKPIDILIPAYDDAAGITAAFNLNLLHRANRELGADFEPSKFRHRSLWNESES
ncbi:MAG: L-histidine N(alpha)-methyltransferase, partial [Pseudomonadota bacterium]